MKCDKNKSEYTRHRGAASSDLFTPVVKFTALPLHIHSFIRLGVWTGIVRTVVLQKIAKVGMVAGCHAADECRAPAAVIELFNNGHKKQNGPISRIHTIRILEALGSRVCHETCRILGFSNPPMSLANSKNRS